MEDCEIFRTRVYSFVAMLLILILFELISAMILKIFFPYDKSSYLKSQFPGFEGVSGKDIVKVYGSFGMVFHPFQLYYNAENYSSLILNVVNHTRVTCYNSDDPDYVIWFFGGSTTFGVGAENDCVTIPSLVSKKLNEKGYKVKVVNYGVSGYYSTQEFIYYSWLLKNLNEKPDVVIFYDGFNEFSSTERSLRDFPMMYWYYKFRIYFPLLYNAYSSSIFKLYQHIYGEMSSKPGNLNKKKLLNKVKSVFSIYAENVRMERALCEINNASCLHFWQPVNSPFFKNLSEHEQRFRKEIHYFDDSYFFVEYVCSKKNLSSLGVISLCSSLKNHSEPLFIDEVHLTKRGNEIMANAMIPYIIEEIENKKNLNPK